MTLTPDIIQRRRDLLQAVREAPEERFDVEIWTGGSSCGTTHCAAGWYAAKHPESGFGFDEYGTLRCKGFEDPFDALASHFGLKDFKAISIFGGCFDETRDEWLARAEAVFAGDEAGE